jgi:hypothetical protein
MKYRPSRRTFLRGSGVALALPALDAMRVARGQSAERLAGGPQRMVAICTYLGMHAPNLLPEGEGAEYETTPYLEPLKDVRENMTVFSGLSHPAVDGGHSSIASFLTAAPHPGSSSFKNTISLDQLAAEQIGSETRFGYLSLSTSGGGLSWTRGGVRIPADDRPSRVCAKLFLEGTAEEIQGQVRRLREGQSIMDLVRRQAKQLEGKLGQRDRDKLDEYFSSVRDLERRVVKAEEWSKKPKPKVDYRQPTDVADKADFDRRRLDGCSACKGFR